MELSERFWRASTEEMKRGYVWEHASESYLCLICGVSFEKGVVYPRGGAFYEAERAVKLHIAEEHHSVLDWLLSLDKRWTGLTELQSRLIRLFGEGRSDEEIVREMQGGSKSTIRNHRFILREKMKQAKVLLSIMELVEEKADSPNRFVSVHRTATMLDERYAVTEKESTDIIRQYFKKGPEGPLSEFPKKEKRKIVILRHLMKRFAPNQSYTEKQVNEQLKPVFSDYVTLRRYLIEYGFMDREPDGSRYWVKQ